jgi:hypothetical protein
VALVCAEAWEANGLPELSYLYEDSEATRMTIFNTARAFLEFCHATLEIVWAGL